MKCSTLCTFFFWCYIKILSLLLNWKPQNRKVQQSTPKMFSGWTEGSFGLLLSMHSRGIRPLKRSPVVSPLSYPLHLPPTPSVSSTTGKCTSTSIPAGLPGRRKRPQLVRAAAARSSCLEKQKDHFALHQRSRKLCILLFYLITQASSDSNSDNLLPVQYRSNPLASLSPRGEAPVCSDDH